MKTSALGEVMNKAVERMTWGGYTTVYAQQTLTAIGDTRPMPEDWIDLLQRFKDQRPLIDAAAKASYELFGEDPFDENEEKLYRVETLTLKESAIAVRLDLTHREKIELIKPLREKRRVVIENRPYRPSRWELESQKRNQRWAIEKEARVIAATAEQMVISDEDRAWATDIGLSLE